VEWQQLTPRYGYEVPKLVEDAGLTDQFELCFDLSLRLHSLLQGAGYPLEAQYATLLGHKLRWKITHNARQAFRLYAGHMHAQPDCRALILAMQEKLREVHPLIGEATTSVN
jgi:hypothetical protein